LEGLKPNNFNCKMYELTYINLHPFWLQVIEISQLFLKLLFPLLPPIIIAYI
jgi:hypothetical protein